MRYIKRFNESNEFKRNNIEGTLITREDIIKCIKNRGLVYATIIKNYPNNDPTFGHTPVDIDDDDLVTIEYDGNEYCIDLKNIEKVEF